MVCWRTGVLRADAGVCCNDVRVAYLHAERCVAARRVEDRLAVMADRAYIVRIESRARDELAGASGEEFADPVIQRAEIPE